MLKKVGALAAGVAAAGLLQPVSSGAANRGANAPEATGGNFIIGQSNSPTSAAHTTSLINLTNAIGRALFRVDNNTGVALDTPPANTYAAGLFHINNQGGGTTSGNFYALYAVGDSTVGSIGYGLRASGSTGGVVAIGGAGGEGVRGICSGSTLSTGVFGISKRWGGR